MRQQIGRTIQAGPLPRGHGLTEVLGVPVDDDCREQVGVDRDQGCVSQMTQIVRGTLPVSGAHKIYCMTMHGQDRGRGIERASLLLGLCQKCDRCTGKPAGQLLLATACQGIGRTGQGHGRAVPRATYSASEGLWLKGAIKNAADCC